MRIRSGWRLLRAINLADFSSALRGFNPKRPSNYYDCLNQRPPLVNGSLLSYSTALCLNCSDAVQLQRICESLDIPDRRVGFRSRQLREGVLIAFILSGGGFSMLEDKTR